jgi:hypothetical protein
LCPGFVTAAQQNKGMKVVTPLDNLSPTDHPHDPDSSADLKTLSAASSEESGLLFDFSLA